MKKLGEELTEEEIEDMIRVGDTTGDKKISRDEFSKVLQVEWLSNEIQHKAKLL